VAEHIFQTGLCGVHRVPFRFAIRDRLNPVRIAERAGQAALDRAMSVKAATAVGVLGLAGAAVVVAACSGRWRG
jgi:hypothetical protein